MTKVKIKSDLSNADTFKLYITIIIIVAITLGKYHIINLNSILLGRKNYAE